MEVTLPDGSPLPSPMTFNYDVASRSGSFTLTTADEALIGLVDLRVVAYYQSYPTVKDEKAFQVEVVAVCEPPHSITPVSLASNDIVLYTFEQAELSIPLNFDIVPTVCNDLIPILTVAPLTPAISLNPSADAINVLTFDQLQSSDIITGAQPATYAVQVHLQTLGGTDLDATIQKLQFTVVIDGNPCFYPDSNHPDCLPDPL